MFYSRTMNFWILASALCAFTVGAALSNPDLNVTATEGSDAKLPCSLDSLAKNISVVWMDQYDNVLYYNENRIIDDKRFTLVNMGRNWDLIIREVDAKDQGRYRCVANTNPIKLKYYELTVFVPPKIITDHSSPDMEPNEGATVRLMCNSTGHPPPIISWSVRPAGTPLGSDKTREIGRDGDIIQIQNVTRYFDEIYTCTARNAYGEPDHHDIHIKVRFSPTVETSQLKVSQYKGLSYSLTCEGSGYKRPTMYFAKDNMEIVDQGSGGKYQYSMEYTDNGYGVKVTLYIRELTEADFGYYKCVAINPLGRAEKYIELKEKIPKYVTDSTQKTTSTSTKATQRATELVIAEREQTTTDQTRRIPNEGNNRGGRQGVLALNTRNPRSDADKSAGSYSTLVLCAIITLLMSYIV